MPRMLPTTQALMVAQSIEVLRLISTEGMSVPGACNQVGITERQYRYWLARGEETIYALKEYITETERQQLATIVVARNTLLTRLLLQLEQATNIMDLISADNHLRNMQRELEDRHGAHGVSDESAATFALEGPKLQRAKSRMGNTVNIATLPDGSVDVTVFPHTDTVIEGESRDLD